MSKTVNKDMKVSKRKNSKKVENIVFHIQGLKFLIDFNPEVYDTYDKVKIKNIVKKMSENIWIDKTYTNFPGNRFKDSFIEYDKWMELIDLLKKTKYGIKVDEDESDLITCTIFTIATFYMYGILEKYGYDIECLDLRISKKSNLYVEYLRDDRKTWNS